MDDAYWTNGHVTFGDGSRDARRLYASCEGMPPLVTLDIIGHEVGWDETGLLEVYVCVCVCVSVCGSVE